ncbi:3-hydroxyacyl-CoA dehydrogenase family protein, partial [Chloroflexota bacterium]
LVQNGLARIRKFLQGSVERNKMSAEEAANVMGRIKTTTEIKEAVQDADLVIEAIVENLEIKHSTWRQVDEAAPARTIFATNTSYLSVTEIASVTQRPEKFLGMHWFNPPQIMRGIEVVYTEKTSPETVDDVLALCRQLGKEPAVCKDSPGFIANRLLGVCRAEALKLYDRQIASVQDIDTEADFIGDDDKAGG